MSYWAVVHTQSRREYAVDSRLIRAGFQTYLPRIKNQTHIEPLFPGYLFVHISHGWYNVRWTQGVIGFLTTCDQHSLKTLMTNIRKSEHNGLIPAQPKFKPGQNVIVARGPFLGQIGTCAGMKGEDRVRVLLKFLGQTVHLELPTTSLHLAG